jgi:glycosyltransferase involved in cell wall biosynthesis
MAILLINHYAGSPSHGMEYRPYYFGRVWVDYGYTVNIVASAYSHVRIHQPVMKDPCTTEVIDGINYTWLNSPSYHGNGIARVINIIWFIFQLLKYTKEIIKDKYPKVVIASSTYPLDIFPAYLIAKRTKAKLVYEVHDLWPLTLIEVGGFSKYHPFIILLQIAENFAYKYADKVISMLPKAIDHMLVHGMGAEKYVHVPNAVDIKDWNLKISPESELHANVIGKARDNGNFLVGYFGTLGMANALDTFIKSASFIREYPIKLILVGQGPEKQKLEQLVREQELTNVVFLPPVPKTDIPCLLSYMDGLYIGLKQSPLFRFGISPNKMLDYMMAGKPVINAIEAGNDPVLESGCGYSVPPNNPDLIAEAIIKLCQLAPEKREEMGSRGRQYIVNNHDVNKLAIYMIEKILDKHVP